MLAWSTNQGTYVSLIISFQMFYCLIDVPVRKRRLQGPKQQLLQSQPVHPRETDRIMRDGSFLFGSIQQRINGDLHQILTLGRAATW